VLPIAYKHVSSTTIYRCVMWMFYMCVHAILLSILCKVVIPVKTISSLFVWHLYRDHLFDIFY